MIWLDITDPKYVLFFRGLIPLLESLDEVLITTRASEGYNETQKLLELFSIPAHSIGGYGGSAKLGKFQARIQRQEGFLKLFESLGEIPKLFITGASVEGVQSAYGLGIPIVNFADTPVGGSVFDLAKITILSRLTLPLSSLVFHPFVVPKICYTAMGLEEKNVLSYDFMDVALWLKDLPKGEDFRIPLGLDCKKPTILVREEEYKAHYVKSQLPIIYESITLLSQKLDANLVIMPRYGLEGLEPFRGMKNVHILEQKLEPCAFYPYIDLLIGGGGTMNLESTYLGIPTISTRSLFLFHDIYLLENHLMQHTKNAQEVLDFSLQALQNFDCNAKRCLNPQKAIFEKQEANFDWIFSQIQERFANLWK